MFVKVDTNFAFKFKHQVPTLRSKKSDRLRLRFQVPKVSKRLISLKMIYSTETFWGNESKVFLFTLMNSDLIDI